MELLVAATSRLRARFYEAPRLLDPPTLIQGQFVNPLGGGELSVAVGTTVLAYPGVWDETQGAVTLTLRFELSPPGATGDEDLIYEPGIPTSFPGLTGVRSLLITPEMANHYLTLHVRAERTGLVNESFYDFFRVLPGTIPPVMGSLSTWPPEIVSSSATLTKPNIVWAAGAVIEPITIAGEWYRNSTPTGVTGATFPNLSATNPLGRAMSEGDIIRWRETCTNGQGAIGVTPDEDSMRTLVSNFIPTLKTHIRSQISARIAGNSGGAAVMNVFNAVSPSGPTATFNASNWLADLRPQLAAHMLRGSFSPSSGYNGASFLTFLITGRHVLGCAHAGVVNDQRYLSFLTADNRVVKAQTISRAVSAEGNKGVDLQILLLDRDLEAEEGIAPLPILSGPDHYINRGLRNYPGDLLPMIGISQVSGPINAFTGAGNPKADYTHPHERMTYIRIPNGFFPGFVQYPTAYNGFHYAPYSGDSGGPCMLLINGVLYVVGMHLGGNMMGNPVGLLNQKNAISELIIDSENRAIGLGRLNALTDLQPNFVDIRTTL